MSVNLVHMRKSIAATDVPHYANMKSTPGLSAIVDKETTTHSYSTEMNRHCRMAHIDRKLKRLSAGVRRPPATGQH